MKNPRINGINWKALKKGDIISHLEIVDYWKITFKDKEWDDICLAMSIIENECGLERTNGSLVKKQTIWELRRKQQTKE